MTRGRAPSPVGRRGIVVLGIAAIGAWAWARLGLDLDGLVPTEGGARIARRFFGAALSPAFDYEADVVGAAPPYLATIAEALGRTAIYAAAALALAFVPGVVLGVLASASFWGGDPATVDRRGLGRVVPRAVRATTRVLIALSRSIHELLWAVVLLAAMGASSATGVLALALPLVGTLAKVFSELLDEAKDAGERGVRGTGVSPFGAFLWGRIPVALPDMAAYTFYRFECAFRSSAVLGFFGFPTIGYFLRASFEENHYREVWACLYGLLFVVVVLERWGAGLRRRFVT
ncbi:MAG: ABC transporter permease subunit [Planctomycetota bacterium]